MKPTWKDAPENAVTLVTVIQYYFLLDNGKHRQSTAWVDFEHKPEPVYEYQFVVGDEGGKPMLTNRHYASEDELARLNGRPRDGLCQRISWTKRERK